MARGIAMVFVAIATGLLVFLWLAPHPVTPPKVATAASPPVSMPTSSALSPLGTANRSGSAPNAPLDAPRSDTQRATDEREQQRAPFYNDLLTRFHDDLREVRANADDGSVLELYTVYDSPTLSQSLIQNAVAPEADRYGFRIARTYLPNAPSALDRYRLDTEATFGNDRLWRIFKK